MEEPLIKNKEISKEINVRINASNESKEIDMKEKNKMDEKQKIERANKSWGAQGKDILGNANIFSRIFFWWSFRIIRVNNQYNKI
jgi:hypothetical protein